MLISEANCESEIHNLIQNSRHRKNIKLNEVVMIKNSKHRKKFRYNNKIKPNERPSVNKTDVRQTLLKRL